MQCFQRTTDVTVGPTRFDFVWVFARPLCRFSQGFYGCYCILCRGARKYCSLHSTCTVALWRDNSERRSNVFTHHLAITSYPYHNRIQTSIECPCQFDRKILIVRDWPSGIVFKKQNSCSLYRVKTPVVRENRSVKS